MPSSKNIMSFLRKTRRKNASPIRTLSRLDGGEMGRDVSREVMSPQELFGAMDKLTSLSDEEKLKLVFSTRKTQAFAFLMNVGNSPESTHRDLVEMGRAGLVSSYLDIVTNDATKKSVVNDKKIWVNEVKYDGRDFSEEVENLFEELEIEERLWQWTHEMCHFGDKYLKLEIVPEKGVVGIRDDFSAMDVLRVEFNGKLAAFVYSDPDFSLMSQPMFGFGNMEFQKSSISGPDSFVHMMINYNTKQSKVVVTLPVADIEAALEREKEAGASGKDSWKSNFMTSFKESRKKTLEMLKRAEASSAENPAAFLESVSFLGVSLGSEIENVYGNEEEARVVVSTRRGWSILMNSRREFKLLNMAEQSAALARFARAPQMRVFYVNTEGATVIERDELIRDLEQRVSRSMSFDADTSIYQDSYSPAGFTDDMFIPVTGLRGDMKVDTIGGDVDVRAMVDIDYFNKRWFSSVHMPQAFMGFEETLPGFNSDKSLVRMDIRYASVIGKVQDSDVNAMKRLVQIHLKYKFFVEVPLKNIDIRMQRSSSAEEAELLENEEAKMSLIERKASLVEQAGGNKEQATRDMIKKENLFEKDDFDKWIKMGQGE